MYQLAKNILFRFKDNMKEITVIKSKRVPNTSVIFDKKETKNRIIYRYYPQNDKTTQKLDEFVRLYKAEDNIKNKKKILEAEKQILLEELQNPELTIVRTNRSNLSEFKRNIKQSKLFNWLTLCAANGFYRMTSIPEKIKPKFTNKDCLILKDVFKHIGEDDEYGLLAKEKIIDILTWKNKTGLLYGLTKNKDLLEKFQKISFNTQEIFKKIQNNNYTSDDLEILLNHNYENPKDAKLVKLFIINLLKKDNIPIRKKRLLVWGAGKFKSEEAYKKLKKIVKNKNEKDILLKEYALHSLAFYVKKHPFEVKKILGQIENENSIFSPLAKILKSKIEGTYHSTKHRALLERNMTEKEIKDFLKIYKKLFIRKSVPQNQMVTNILEESLLNYKNSLKQFVELGLKIGISDETITKLEKNRAGKRCLLPFLDKCIDIFDDNTTGIAILKNFEPSIIMSELDILYNWTNIPNHELAHQLQTNILTKKEYQKSFDIYKKSNENKRPLDDYAETNEKEYFACAMDAFLSPYRAHEHLLNYANSRYKLMVKDKKMYKFLEQIYQKYCQY